MYKLSYYLCIKVAGKKIRGRQYPWGFVEVDNPEHSDISLMDYMKMLDNYKHQGHGTAMYDMAADVLDRETRGGHVIVRDDNQTNNAERMWAKHKDRSNWPHRGQR